jgi:hypothetical protein
MMSIKWSDAESESDKILRQIEICKSAAEMQQCQDPVILEDLCALEYCATVGLVYLDFFMNRTKKLTRENIDHTELIIKKSFEFFERWRLDQLSERDRQHSLSSRAKTWEKRFLSHVTYLNMRIGICGFFVYSRYMLEASSTTKFIPFLHSNSSIIEALFSQIRRMQRDTPLKYAAGAGAADTMLGSIHLDNGMYCAADLAESASPCKTLEKVTHRMDRIRDTTVAEWMSGRVQPTDDLLVNLCQYYSGDDAQVDYNTARNSSLLNVVKVMRSTMPCHYSDVLWSDPDFVEYAKLSVGTPVQECFQTTALFSEADNEAFDVICQQLFFEIQMGAKALGGSTRSIHRSFMFQAFDLQTNQCKMSVLKTFIATIICQGESDPGLSIFCQLLVDFIAKFFVREFNKAIDEWLDQLRQSANAKIVTPTADDIGMTGDSSSGVESIGAAFRSDISHEEQCKEVQLFLGWAMSSITNMYEIQAESDDSMEEVCQFCKEMHLTHDEVIVDEAYVRDYYPRIIQLKNRGDFSLVSRSYFCFGVQLLQKIRDSFNQESISQHGTSCVEIAFDVVSKDDSLRDTFIQCQNSFSSKLDSRIVSIIYDKLVRKTFHARIGAETTIFKDKNTSRFAVDAVDTSLREGLKTIAKRGQKKKNSNL